MKMISHLFAAFLLGSLMMHFCGCAVPQEEEQFPDFTGAKIVIPADASEGIRNAAALLRSCLDKMEGTGGAGREIHLNLAAPDEQNGKRTWQIVQQGNRVVITGRSPSSLIFGVADFLNRSGFYVLSWDCDALPDSGKLLVPTGLAVNGKMAFGKTRIVDGLRVTRDSPALKEFRRYQQMNYSLQDYRDDDSIYASWHGIHEVHNIYQYLPPDRYAKDHPEYYTQNPQGGRSWTNTDHFCFSNPEVRRIVTENLLKKIAEHRKNGPPYPVYYNISQNDCGHSFCSCPECQALIRKYEGETGLLLEFINAVAGEVAKVYPDVKIGTEAYVNSEAPAKGIRPARNVIIRFCDLYSRSDCRIPLEDQPERRRLLEEWARLSPGLAIWDYLNFGRANSPETAIHTLSPNLLLFRKNGVGNILLEDEYDFVRPQNFVVLQLFLARQLLKDPAQDAEKLTDIFMRSYYGPCAEDMRQFYELLHTRLKQGQPTSDPDFLQKARGILTAALEKAGTDPRLKARVLSERNNVEYCLLCQLKLRGMDPAEFQERAARYRDDLDFVLNENTLPSDDAREKIRKGIREEADRLTIDFPLPEELQGRDLKNVLKVGLSFFWAVHNSGAQIEADPDSEMKSVLTIHGKNKKHKMPFPVGCYDWLRKTGKDFTIRNVIADGRYHWYKLGNITIGPKSVVWLHGSWAMMANLYSLHINDDGLQDSPENPNIYELWVSLKFRGPAYSGETPGKESDPENGVWLDKVLLVSPAD